MYSFVPAENEKNDDRQQKKLSYHQKILEQADGSWNYVENRNPGKRKKKNSKHELKQ